MILLSGQILAFRSNEING